MRTIIAANWKMNKTRTEAKATAHELASILGGAPDDRDVIVFAPFTALEAAKEGLDGAPGIFIGAQNMYPAESGAFTGEISPAMLREAGCTWVLTGHSERRHVLGESPDFVGKKTAASFGSSSKGGLPGSAPMRTIPALPWLTNPCGPSARARPLPTKTSAWCTRWYANF